MPFINFGADGFTGPSIFAGGSEQTLTLPGNVTVSGGLILSSETNLSEEDPSVYATDSYNDVPGLTDPITITFPSPVSSFSVAVFNGQTNPETYTISDNVGDSTTIALADNSSSDEGTVVLPVSQGATVFSISSSVEPWDFSIDNIAYDVSPRDTSIPGSSLLSKIFGIGSVALSAPAAYYSAFAAEAAPETGGLSLIEELFEAMSIMGFTLGGLSLVDPFDENYKQVYSPVFVSLPTVQPDSSVSQAMADDANAALSDASKAVSYMQAMYITLNRFDSATQEGDAVSAASQNVAFDSYLALSSSSLNAFGEALTPLINNLSANSASLTADQVTRFINGVRSGGFSALPQEEQSIIQQFGFSTSEQDLIASNLSSVTSSDVPLSLQAALQLEDADVSEVSSVYGSVNGETTIVGPTDSTFLTATQPTNSVNLDVVGNVALSGIFSTGALTVGATNSPGTLDLANGSSVGASSAALVDGSINLTGQETSLIVNGLLSISASVSNTLPVPFDTLTVNDGAEVRVGELAFVPATSSFTYAGFSYVSIDASSSFEIGSLGGAALGSFTIDPSSTFIGSGLIKAPAIVVNGTINAQNEDIILEGPESGSGSIQIGSGSYAALDENSVSTGAVGFSGAGGTLAISYSSNFKGLNDQGTISNFAPGDTIVYDGDYLGVYNPLTSAVYTASSANSGTLTLKDGNTVLGTLNLTGNYAGDIFQVIPGVSPGYYDISPVTAPGSDFNGDGTSDILFQNTNGSIDTWLLNDATVTSGSVIANPGTSWHAAGTGDFNGDGKSDILFQNDDGTVDIWLVNGQTVTSGTVVANPGPSWHIVGTGDFNGDGKSDIVFQNNDGSVDIWEMNGTTVLAGTVIANPGTAWHVVGSGDFEGTGQTDLLLQNDDGTVETWQTNGTSLTSGTVVANPGPSWHIVGTGDFNGDGKSDIVLQNNDGTVYVWEMNGSSVASSTEVGDPGPSWHAISVGDYNGDGKPDILFQNDGGTVETWLMNGTSVVSGSVIANPGTAWQPIGQNSIHFINGTQSTGILAGTILNDDFVFTTSQPGMHLLQNFDPLHDMISLDQTKFGSYAAIQTAESTVNGSTVLTLGTNDTLTINGVLPGALSAKNFV